MTALTDEEYGLEAYEGNGWCECDYGLCVHTGPCLNIADVTTLDEHLICRPCIVEWGKDGLMEQRVIIPEEAST